jgi:hypothetical protein
VRLGSGRPAPRGCVLLPDRRRALRRPRTAHLAAVDHGAPGGLPPAPPTATRARAVSLTRGRDVAAGCPRHERAADVAGPGRRAAPRGAGRGRRLPVAEGAPGRGIRPGPARTSDRHPRHRGGAPVRRDAVPAGGIPTGEHPALLAAGERPARSRTAGADPRPLGARGGPCRPGIRQVEGRHRVRGTSARRSASVRTRPGALLAHVVDWLAAPPLRRDPPDAPVDCARPGRGRPPSGGACW